MHFDRAAIPRSGAQKHLVRIVAPRPIAPAKTADRAGRDNAAAFSVAEWKDARR